MEYSRRGDEMLKFPFHMNPEVEIFLIFPFRLGVETVPLSASKRKEIFPRWVQRLIMDK